MNKPIKPYNIKYSQNFISSSKKSEEIINSIDIKPNDEVIEIGPGKGFLTEFIGKKAAKVIGVEKDYKLFLALKEKFKDNSKVEFVNKDFLEYKMPNNSSYKVIGNIPFALTADIFRKVLDSFNPPAQTTLIVQKESTERLISNGLETLFALSYKPWFESRVIKNLSRDDFTPRPNVDTVLLNIVRLSSPRVPLDLKKEYLDFITYVFTKQKNLRQGLKEVFTFTQMSTLFKQHKINFYAKPPEIKFDEWLILFDTFMKYVPKDKRDEILHARANLKRQQRKITKSHRTRNAFRTWD